MSQKGDEIRNTEEISLRKRRNATIYDVVDGRIGINGFLTDEEMTVSTKALVPEEVLMRKTGLSGDDFNLDYQAEGKLEDPAHDLPESDLLKAVHAYASDFYNKATREHGVYDFGSMDGTALIAVGFLLEEAMHKILGANGDMALVEPRGRSNGVPESRMTKYQIHGKVRLPPTPPPVDEDESESDEKSPKKRRL